LSVVSLDGQGVANSHATYLFNPFFLGFVRNGEKTFHFGIELNVREGLSVSGNEFAQAESVALNW